MGIYLNPGCKGFQTIRNGVYVDKTGLIDYVNSTINTPLKLTCFSRPRRFGKSFAAKMLCAYYDKSCDSRSLFEGLEISKKDSFEKGLNKYDVIYLDITWFISRAQTKGDNLILDIQAAVIEELKEAFSDCVKDDETYLPEALSGIANKTNRQFVIIIDEWDALFRESKDDEALQKEYLQLLRGLFKSGPSTDETIAAAYMTGILPVKKYGTESALTDFREYTMTRPGKLAEYVGFTETEVKQLCDIYQMDFEDLKIWYDGYSFSRIAHVYSPNSVINALQEGEILNYWTQTESFESLKQYIEGNFDGLKDAIIAMLGNESVKMKISTFQNDITSFKCADDVLTLLVHLGYLAYDPAERTARIPNLEVSEIFEDAVNGDDWGIVGRALAESDKLLDATINQNEEAVEEALEKIHGSVSSVLQYNNEASLSCALTIAYYTAKRFYYIIRELPAGKGFADLAFIPHRNTDRPAMIVELKYDRDADTAIRQIHDNRYDGALKEHFGNLLLVGISYEKDAKGQSAKKHRCVIERAQAVRSGMCGTKSFRNQMIQGDKRCI
ncbi:MAG: ATP-binding protein [Lachnospiraceae bacterium]|nr:ATP-binding protein [Lachnospiraceae bacterium]